jgi:NAD(P)-dependent dehydrogenase (short-subunit alcohol dehydrogenase family)
MRDFAGKVAVVTGAASGIGFALATRFAEEGMKVVLADVEEPALGAAVTQLRQREFDVQGVVTDVASLRSIEALRDKTLETYGGVHVLCNNAGVGGLFTVPMWATTAKDWQWTVGVNLMGPVNAIQTFVPGMLASGEEGHVVNTASIAGIMPGNRIYGATKHAVVALSEALYADLKRANARVSCSVLCPSVIKTQMTTAFRNRPDELQNEDNDADRPEEREARERLMRLTDETGIEPSEVAEMVLQAIRDDQFWILNDDRAHEGVLQRAQDIVSRRNPPSARVPGTPSGTPQQT